MKTDYNTIDPITKKEIVDPVRNKKCKHIYEKSTMNHMIDRARENNKPVRCPYMGSIPETDVWYPPLPGKKGQNVMMPFF